MTDIIVALIGLIGTIITAVLIPYIRSKTTKEKYDNIYTWVSIAVSAAEQIFKDVQKAGKLKKEYVLAFLNQKGFNINEDELDAMIEAAVLELNKLKEAIKPNENK